VNQNPGGRELSDTKSFQKVHEETGRTYKKPGKNWVVDGGAGKVEDILLAMSVSPRQAGILSRGGKKPSFQEGMSGDRGETKRQENKKINRKRRNSAKSSLLVEIKRERVSGVSAFLKEEEKRGRRGEKGSLISQ